jgi:Tfp pilus assembly protein PilF
MRPGPPPVTMSQPRRVNSGLAYAKQGEDSKAIAALKRALSLSQTFDGAADAKRVLADLNIQ